MMHDRRLNLDKTMMFLEKANEQRVAMGWDALTFAEADRAIGERPEMVGAMTALLLANPAGRA
jgi:hypothetical protein